MKSKNIYIPAAVIAICLVLLQVHNIRSEKISAKEVKTEAPLVVEGSRVITLAGGCFWCIEAVLQESPGVIDAVSGYSGGVEKTAKYLKVITGKTKHRESVQVRYDPEIITDQEVLNIFWSAIDPTDTGGQFADKGFQYTTAIFYHDLAQKEIALHSKNKLSESGLFEKDIATKIVPFETFFPAEEYHQDYYKKSSDHYKRYESGSGRKGFVDDQWAQAAAIEFLSKTEPLLDENLKEARGDNSSELVWKNPNYSSSKISELQKELSDESYSVLVKNGTERPFKNKYWESEKKGIYVDPITGEPLFSSTHKYDSGTGWPSFWQSIDSENLDLVVDKKILYTRTEVRSTGGHLGHLFNDGPKEKTGLRYCINSASLKFIPTNEMKNLGYQNYLYLFNS